MAELCQNPICLGCQGLLFERKERFRTYVEEEAPWHKTLVETIDLSRMPLNPTKEEIETRLQQEKVVQEVQIKRDVAKIIAGGNLEGLEKSVKDIVEKISGTSQNDLIHYIALRRAGWRTKCHAGRGAGNLKDPLHGRYKLVGHDAVPVEDLIEWAMWLESADRQVRLTRVGPTTISTVFLGLDHSYGGGPPHS